MKCFQALIWINILGGFKLVLGVPGPLQPAQPHEFPFQVSFGTSNSHYCSGALLNEKTVVTTANCCQFIGRSEVQVFVGIYELENIDEATQVVGISNVQVHEDYDSNTLINDICLVTLDSQVQVNDFVSLIDINDEVLVTDDTTLMESGWSYFDKRMLKMQVTYKSDEECVEQYGAQQYISQSMICIEEAIDCLADNGAPLTKDGFLYGISSWGIGCGSGNTIFTDLQFFKGWIFNNIQQ